MNRTPPDLDSATPEISSCPSVTVEPAITMACPSSASTFVTSPARAATTLARFSRSTISGGRLRSTTCTWAVQPFTFTDSQEMSSSSSSTWLRSSS